MLITEVNGILEGEEGKLHMLIVRVYRQGERDIVMKESAMRELYMLLKGKYEEKEPRPAEVAGQGSEGGD